MYWLWLTVLETTTLNRANVFTFLVPLFGFTMGVAFYAEIVTAPLLVGMAVTIAGIVAVNRDRPTPIAPDLGDDPALWPSGRPPGDQIGDPDVKRCSPPPRPALTASRAALASGARPRWPSTCRRLTTL